jgi:hypothetical protein
MGQIQIELTRCRISLHEEDMRADDNYDEKIVEKEKREPKKETIVTLQYPKNNVRVCVHVCQH